MRKYAEFEEKDFEGPLYRQLLMDSYRCATPGQVFEHAFGIDAALEAQHPIFFDFFGYRNVPDGINLPDFNWGWVWHRYGDIRDLPSFPVNVLIQSKRPELLAGRRSDFRRRGIHGRYWRFEITEHQQFLLEKLEHQLRGRALVVYASAAFDTFADLYTLTENKLVVENTSFVKPSRLIDHSTWNYDRAGTRGIAASKPKQIIDTPFTDDISQMLDNSSFTKPKDNFSYLHKAMSVVLREESTNPICLYFNAMSDSLLKAHPMLNGVRSEVMDFIQSIRFVSLLGLRWALYGNEK